MRMFACCQEICQVSVPDSFKRSSGTCALLAVLLDIADNDPRSRPTVPEEVHPP